MSTKTPTYEHAWRTACTLTARLHPRWRETDGAVALHALSTSTPIVVVKNQGDDRPLPR